MQLQGIYVRIERATSGSLDQRSTDYGDLGPRFTQLVPVEPHNEYLSVTRTASRVVYTSVHWYDFAINACPV